MNRPTLRSDPSGLANGGGAIDTPAGTYWPDNKDCAKGCAEAIENRKNKKKGWDTGLGNPGIVICYKGTMCACVVPATDHPDPGICKAYDKCTLDHEKLHFDDYLPCVLNNLLLLASIPPGVTQEEWDRKFECQAQGQHRVLGEDNER